MTFDQTPPSVDDRRDRLRELARNGWPVPVLVLVLVNTSRFRAQIQGYAYVAPWRPKPAYHDTVENSIYVGCLHLGQGHGRRLLNELSPARRRCWSSAGYRGHRGHGYAASLALHRAAGFTPAGTLRRVGYKHHRWLDTALLQRELLEFRGMSTLG